MTELVVTEMKWNFVETRGTSSRARGMTTDVPSTRMAPCNERQLYDDFNL